MNIILWSQLRNRYIYNEERWFRKVSNVIFANLDRDTDCLSKHPYLNFFLYFFKHLFYLLFDLIFWSLVLGYVVLLYDSV